MGLKDCTQSSAVVSSLLFVPLLLSCHRCSLPLLFSRLYSSHEVHAHEAYVGPWKTCSNSGQPRGIRIRSCTLVIASLQDEDASWRDHTSKGMTSLKGFPTSKIHLHN